MELGGGVLGELELFLFINNFDTLIAKRDPTTSLHITIYKSSDRSFAYTHLEEPFLK